MRRPGVQCECVRRRDESHPGGTEWDISGFHHTTENGAKFKTYELLISGIFHLICSALVWPWVPETVEGKVADGGHCVV